jgi:hypothetical protein
MSFSKPPTPIGSGIMMALGIFSFAGIQAVAGATVGTGMVTKIAVTTPGTSYATPPTVALTGGGGTGATATASVSGGAIIGFTITNPGANYTSAPTVGLSGGGGSGGVGTATINGLTAITVSNGGSGHGTAPAVSFTGGGGSGAAATAVLTGNVVTSINITNPGSGYTSTPTVVIAAPDGLATSITIPCPYRTVFTVTPTAMTDAAHDDNLRWNATPVSNVVPNVSLGNITISRTGSALTANLSFGVLMTGQG